ncbi:hypothetical protein HYU16_01880 [Candidatus Woesearchaeota archaeon]|nr:hypothetical protein [Candidatus Woesearchaeota archaeon]MBI2550177.1 hypothetical protein [Candidatus Woesearchaeota archaeon]
MKIPSEFELRSRLEALQRAREGCEERKIELFKAINKLKQDLQEGLIGEQRYNAEIAKLPKSPQQIISDCNSEIAAIDVDIDSCREQLSSLREDKKNERIRTAVILAALLLFSVGLPLLTIKLTGFVVSEEVTAYTQDITTNFTASQTFALNIERTGGVGELRSLLLGGKLIGDGKARVYLERGTERYLILNESAIKEKGVTSAKALTSITGRAVEEVKEAKAGKPEEAKEKAKEEKTKELGKEETAENATQIPLSNETEANATSENATAEITLPAPEQEAALQNETQNLTQNETLNQTQPPEAEPELPPELPSAIEVEKAINVSLAYKSGTIFDANDDGIELDILAIDFTVEGTNFSWDADQSKLCTRWVTHSIDDNSDSSICHGSAECCALVELTPFEENWDTPLDVFVGRYGATYNNTVSSQVIFANYSLDPENVYSEIYYSEFSSLPAKFATVPPLEGGIMNETNKTVAVTEFSNVCVETCSLSGIAGLNLSEYTLVIEVENATLTLSNVTYTLAKVTEIDIEPPIVTITQPRNTTYTETIASGEVRNTTTLRLDFTVNEPANSVWYSLNSQDSVTIATDTAAGTTATTITAANGTNTLLLFANDTSGNVGYAVAEFFVNITAVPIVVIDLEPPIINISSPLPNATYNTTFVPLSFALSEPATVSYFLNLQNKTEIASNVTLAAEEGRNRLLLLATDIAGNVAHESIVFFVNTSNVTAANITVNITPLLKSKKSHFKLGEDAELEFEYIQKKELVKAGKWKDGYEAYEDEDDYEEFLETVSAAKKSAVEQAIAAEKAKPKRRQVGEWAAPNETITAQLFDSEGREVGIGAEIEELREGRFGIKLPKQRAFKAGLYTLMLSFTKDGTIYTEQQDFTWGVLAINTNKSIFLPNEDAFVAMAVLDDQGHMVCDADVTLTITDPAGEAATLTTTNSEISVSDECKVLGVTNLPDYYTTYKVKGAGTYVMNLTAATANGVRTILDNFTVQSQVDFDVARAGPTRIYPPVPYTMNFTVTASDSYNGQITEFVPASFVIAPQDGLTVATAAGAKVLTWNKALKKGETASFYYQFDAPDISPEFYVLGELGIGAWKEARQWQIASDLVPAQDVNFTTPDAAAPGMNIIVQFVGASFNDSEIVKLNVSSSVIFVGQPIVSNESGHANISGKVLTVPFFINASAANQDVQVNVSGKQVNGVFKIITPAPQSGNFTGLSGNRVLGNVSNGNRTKGGTIVLDSLIIPSGLTVTINLSDSNTAKQGDQGYLPAVLVVDGPVDIQGILSVNGSDAGAVSGDIGGQGGDGGPGGGGGGAGGGDIATQNRGGHGFTGGGGGSCEGDQALCIEGKGGNGTGTQGGNATQTGAATSGWGGDGGNSTTPYAVGATGGKGDGVDGSGGGGGTGFFFGTSGKGGVDTTDAEGAGGFGGGGGSFADAGGGGGYGTAGVTLTGGGGSVYGNAQIVPLTGGSGGGGGGATSSAGGGGGGGGGAVLIIASGNVSVSGTVASIGGAGSSNTADTAGEGDGGGGSGGAIVIQSSNVSVTGTLTTLNGTSGVTAAPAGAGRVRVDGLGDTSAFAGETISGSNYTGPAIKEVTSTSVIGVANITSDVRVIVQNLSNSNSSFSGTTDTAGSFNIAVTWYTGTNFITVIQNTSTASDVVSVHSSAALATYFYTPPPSDTTVPDVAIIVPRRADLNNTNISGNFVINASVNDSASNVLQVNLTIYNHTGNVTKLVPMNISTGTRLSGYWNKTFDSTTLPDGRYNLSVNATDSAATPNTAISANVSITIDNTKPNATIVNPLNNTNISATMLINASVNDSLSKVFNVTFMLYNNTVNATGWLLATNGANTIDQGYWNTTFNTTTIREAAYNITINATDFSGNQLVLNLSTVIIDNTRPNATTLLPANQSNLSGTVTIRAGANDSLTGILNVTFQFRNSTNQTSRELATLNTGTIYAGEWTATYNTAQLADGKYNITFNATDFAGSSNVTDAGNYQNFTVTIDNTAPNGTVISPANATNVRGFFYVNASVNDSLTKVQNVSLRLRSPGVEGPLVYAKLLAGTIDQGVWNATFNSSAVPNGVYNITLNASDFAGSRLLVNTSNVVVNNTGVLNVTLNYAGNNVSQNRTFSVNATIACLSGYCQQVNATVYYNLTSISPSTRINATAKEIPLHNVTAYVNQTCGYMEIDAVCNLNWTINATGPTGSSYFLSINFTSNNTELAQNGTRNFQINISETAVANTAPIVFNSSVALNSSVTLTEGTTKVVAIRFNVTDADGTSDIANAAVGVNISFNGIRRANNSGNCANLGDSDANTRLFSCNVTFNYFDNSTTLWDINITAADASGAVGYNDSQSLGGRDGSHNLTVNSLSALSLVTTSVVSTANLGTTNNELSIVINNTGNFDFTQINVTPYDLNASLTDLFRLNGNFSINATQSTSSGFGSNLQNGTPNNFTDSSETSATLPHKITSGEGDNLGNRTVYIYIDVPQNKGLSTGVTYNISAAWEIWAE